jgi:hypothetical protein
VERAKEYRRTAARLRRLADCAQYPEVQAELTWLAQSYDRLAADPSVDRIHEGIRCLEIAQEQSSPADSIANSTRTSASSD